MPYPVVSSHLLVHDLLEGLPGAVGLFVAMRLACAGCEMSTFCALEEVSIHYGLAPETLLHDIEEALRSPRNDRTTDE